MGTLISEHTISAMRKTVKEDVPDVIKQLTEILISSHNSPLPAPSTKPALDPYAALDTSQNDNQVVNTNIDPLTKSPPSKAKIRAMAKDTAQTMFYAYE